MSRILACLLLGLLALFGSGCAGSVPARDGAAMPRTRELSRCRVDTARARRAVPRIRADIARIRRAGGHARTSAATDRFISDLERSTLSLTTQNRLIDLAVSASLGKCDDCFQALEAMRPIPALAAHRCR